MLLDEPFAGIDPIAVLDIQEIIAQLKGRSIGVLISDHTCARTLASATVPNPQRGTHPRGGDPAAIAASPGRGPSISASNSASNGESLWPWKSASNSNSASSW